MLTVTQLFACDHATIDKHWSGVTQVIVKAGDGYVLTTHASPTRAAIALAKGSVCDCCTAWGRVKLGKAAHASASATAPQSDD